jgi:hypothetical protein
MPTQATVDHRFAAIIVELHIPDPSHHRRTTHSRPNRCAEPKHRRRIIPRWWNSSGSGEMAAEFGWVEP